MSPLRFQFTIRGLLWATFWVALSCPAWVVAMRNLFFISSLTPPPSAFDYFSLFVAFAAPLVAVGALFNRTMLGLIVGGISGLAMLALREFIA